MIERWKDIPGYDGKYQASTEGNIRRTLKSGQFRSMTPYHKKMKGSQRLVVKLTKDGKAKEEIVLSLIASRRKAIRRLELAGGYTPMPTAPAVEFEF